MNQPLYNPEYEKARNALIPLAEASATQRVKAFGEKWDLRHGADGKMVKWDYWTQFFHEEMNKLWEESDEIEIIDARRHERRHRLPGDFEQYPSDEQKEYFKRGGR